MYREENNYWSLLKWTAFYGSFFLTHFFVTLLVCFGSLSCWNTHLRFIFVVKVLQYMTQHPLIVILYFFHFLKLNTKCCYPLTKPFLDGLRAHSFHFCAGLQSRPSHPLTYLWSKDVRNMMLERKKLIPWRNVLHITSWELYVVICSQVESWSSCKWLTQLINGSQNSGWVTGKPILISLNFYVTSFLFFCGGRAGQRQWTVLIFCHSPLERKIFSFKWENLQNQQGIRGFPPLYVIKFVILESLVLYER